MDNKKRTDRESPVYRCSVHTHTTLCDGKGTPEEMARAAYLQGVQYYGFSCHSHTPILEDAGNVLPADMTEYKRRVLALRTEYSGKMDIMLGIEWDSFSDISPAGFDYWIGSVHYQSSPDGKYYAADWNLESFCLCRDEVYGGDALGVTEGYFEQVAEVAAKKPTILGHIDLITKLNSNAALFDEEDPRYKKAALAALHAADPKETLLEINTGAMSRGYRDTPYPALFLLKEWKEMGGRVILTSDTHHPDTILYAYDRAAAIALAAGFTTAAVLTSDCILDCPI